MLARSFAFQWKRNCFSVIFQTVWLLYTFYSLQRIWFLAPFKLMHITYTMLLKWLNARATVLSGQKFQWIKVLPRTFGHAHIFASWNTAYLFSLTSTYFQCPMATNGLNPQKDSSNDNKTTKIGLIIPHRRNTYPKMWQYMWEKLSQKYEIFKILSTGIVHKSAQLSALDKGNGCIFFTSVHRIRFEYEFFSSRPYLIFQN